MVQRARKSVPLKTADYPLKRPIKGNERTDRYNRGARGKAHIVIDAAPDDGEKI